MPVLAKNKQKGDNSASVLVQKDHCWGFTVSFPSGNKMFTFKTRAIARVQRSLYPSIIMITPVRKYVIVPWSR